MNAERSSLEVLEMQDKEEDLEKDYKRRIWRRRKKMPHRWNYMEEEIAWVRIKKATKMRITKNLS